ncbi:Glu/Leu/Phe/Val dehydrogenase [Mycolicibacterium farcinogenes]|nr:Glu/Leu/Phe/Val dehydrogenase [Mycolicibacterium farcinogenes]
MATSGAQPGTLRIERLDVPGYEDVRTCEDAATGLRAIIAVDDTRLGPALGGTRFYPYPDDAAALTDVRRLSAGMTYKAAAADLPLGGGKAVIIGDPAAIKTPALLRSYGTFVDSFDGRYVTAADGGTTSADLDIVGETTRHVAGLTEAAGGFGDSSMSTALGVLAAIRAAALSTLNRTLAGIRVGVEGVGKVGSCLVDLLLDAGAGVVVSERYAPARAKLQQTHPELSVVEDLFDAPIDVYAPCALGATLTQESVAALRASIVCGAANNQLSNDDVEGQLFARQIVWVPDYVANAGGLIQAAAERDGRTLVEARDQIRQLENVVLDILRRAEHQRGTPARAAKEIADERLGLRR